MIREFVYIHAPAVDDSSQFSFESISINRLIFEYIFLRRVNKNCLRFIFPTTQYTIFMVETRWVFVFLPNVRFHGIRKQIMHERATHNLRKDNLRNPSTANSARTLCLVCRLAPPPTTDAPALAPAPALHILCRQAKPPLPHPTVNIAPHVLFSPRYPLPITIRIGIRNYSIFIFE